MLHDRYVGVHGVDSGPVIAEATFIELFALSSALPGPTSSQLVLALGTTFGGLLGAILTSVIWLLPGSLIMTLGGLWFHSHLQSPSSVQVVSRVAEYGTGLIAAAFSLVVIAALKMTQTTCQESRLLMAVCISSGVIAVLIPASQATWIFLALLFSGGTIVAICSVITARESESDVHTSRQAVTASDSERWQCGINSVTGVILVVLYTAVSIYMLLWNPSDFEGTIFKTFWTMGATVYGGGQVVIPWILNEIVESKWLPSSVFLSGFGFVGICPGSMFNISWFLGGALLGLRGAVVASVGLQLPGMILMVGVLPFWERVRLWSGLRTFLSGVNAAAAGLIIAGVWMLLRRALTGPLAFSLSIIAGAMTTSYGISKPVAMLACGLAGMFLVHVGVGGPYS